MQSKLTMKILIAVLLFLKFISVQAQTPPQGEYLASFDGVKIYFEVAGSGYPVVLVHGFTGSSESWKKGVLYNDLLASGYKVITVDLRGGGRSDKPHSLKSYQHDAEAKDIMQVVKHLGIKSYFAVGYSRGSIIVSRLIVNDRRLKRAVLGGMGDDFMDPNWPRRVRFYKALTGEEPAEDLMPMIKRIEESGLDRIALACQQGAQPSTSAVEFSKVKKPVLVICGDQDSDNGSASALAKFIPGSTYLVVPGNHGSASRTQEFSNGVLAFIKK